MRGSAFYDRVNLKAMVEIPHYVTLRAQCRNDRMEGRDRHAAGAARDDRGGILQETGLIYPDGGLAGARALVFANAAPDAPFPDHPWQLHSGGGSVRS